MIREDTQPGTKIVAIKVDGWPPSLPNLVIDAVYTVNRMVECIDDTIGVVTGEHPQPSNGIAYDREAFRYFDLPESLTRLQKVENISTEELRELVKSSAK